MDLLERTSPLALTRPRAHLDLVPLHGGLTRVLRHDGGVIGYVETIDDGAGGRFRAKRLAPRAAGFRVIGEFWTADDALDALVFD
jgi:hypothetical protein